MTVLSSTCPVGANAAEPPCRVELQPPGPGGVRVIRLSGVPGMRDSRRVHEVMAAALLGAPTVVVVDVSGVDHLDGDGVMLLILMRRQARRLGPRLPLAGAAPAVAHSVRMLDPNGLLHLHATVYEAIRVNAARARPASTIEYAGRAAAVRTASLSSRP